MKFLKKYTFVRVFYGTEEMVEIRNNEVEKSFFITRRRFITLRDYLESTMYILWEDDELK